MLKLSKFLAVGVTSVCCSIAANAFADEMTVTKQVLLRSSEGITIGVTAQVAESEVKFVQYGREYRNKTIKNLAVGITKANSDRFIGDGYSAPAQAVLTLKCSASHYPSSWSYSSSSVIDLNTSEVGPAAFGQKDLNAQIELVTESGGDVDGCRVELSVVAEGRWQVDPVNGSHNFILSL